LFDTFTFILSLLVHFSECCCYHLMLLEWNFATARE